MSFLQPLFFWASALIIPLAAIYFLKVRPRRDTTTAIFLWQRIYQQKQASSLLNRLRDLLSLLLLVLAFMLLTLAMAKPQFVSADGNDLLILIDNSASMAAKAKSDSRTRLEEACKHARDIVTGMGAGKRAAIASVADQIDYKSYLSDNSKQLVRAIDSIEQSEIPFNIDALKKASGSLGSQKNSRVILISDAAAFTVDSIVKKEKQPLAESTDAKDYNSDDPNQIIEIVMPDKPMNRDTQIPGGIELVRIAAPAENIGIVSCDLKELVTEDGKMSFYCRLANSGEKTVQTDLLLYHIDAGESAEQLRRISKGQYDQIPGTLVKAMPATITPGLNEPMFFDLAENLAGRYIALLDYSDATALDNAAYLTIPDADPIRIGVLNQDRFFFEHCIQAFSQSTGLIELTRLSENNDKGGSEMRIASDAETIKSDIDTLASGGGTCMHPGMSTAYEMLQQTTSKIKHVIILSDGQSQPADHQGLASEMADFGITVSTVAMGNGADRPLLSAIAEIGKGRYYETTDPENVPQIFTRETMQASKSAIKEDIYPPLIISDHPMFAGTAEDELPFCFGYVMAKPKPTAQVLLAAETGDPLLAISRFGLGVGLAYTSDVTEKWGGEWLAWDKCGSFWAQVFRNVVKRADTEGIYVTSQAAGNKWIVDIKRQDPDSKPINSANLQLRCVDQNNSTSQISAEQVGLGVYRAVVPLEGIASASLSIQDADYEKAAVIHYNRPYHAEYDLTCKPNDKLVAQAQFVPAEITEKSSR